MNETQKATTPLQYLWDEIKIKGRPFTYNLYMEAEKIQRNLIIDTFNEGAVQEALGNRPRKPYTNVGEQHYSEVYE